MSIDTSVKFFHSGMTGALQLTATAGSLLTILRACLVSGFGAVSVDSIAVASGVATLTISAGMPFNEVDSVILVSGCALAALNGEKKIAALGTTTLTFDASGLSDGSYSGGISAKIAPAGWAELFTGTNVAVFQSLSPQSTKCCLRVDDTGTTDARVVGYEAMSDLNTGAGQVPLNTQIAGGGYWAKANNATGSRKWAIFADSRSVYLWAAPYSSYPYAGVTYFFGDLIAGVANDPFAFAIQVGDADDSTLSYPNARLGIGGYIGLYTPRNANGQASSTNMNRGTAFSGSSGQYAFGDSSAALTFPSGKGNSLSSASILCYGESALGVFPGALAPICKCGALPFLSRIVIAGRKHAALPLAGSGSGPIGSLFVDVGGPWQ